ncbi:MAG: GNAT family N-acetyltransferase [Litorilinea sp.]
MAHGISIRAATAQDAPELVRLNSLFNGEEEPPGQLAQRLQDPRRVETPLLAEMGGCVAGFAALRIVPCIFYPEPYAELTELYVEPAYRGRGVGRALVRYAEQMAIEAGADQLFILTGFDNQPALALYRGLGYADYDLALCKQLPPQV